MEKLDYDIICALRYLADKLPLDRVDIWVEWNPNSETGKELSFSAYVGDRPPLPRAFGRSVTNAMEAVQDVLSKCGERNEETKLKVRIEAIKQKRAELAKLESELDPLVVELGLKQQAPETIPATPPAVEKGEQTDDIPS